MKSAAVEAHRRLKREENARVICVEVGVSSHPAAPPLKAIFPHNVWKFHTHKYPPLHIRARLCYAGEVFVAEMANMSEEYACFAGVGQAICVNINIDINNTLVRSHPQHHLPHGA